MDVVTQMRLEFNRYLLDAIGGQVLDTSIFAWSGGFTKWLLAFCMAIAFFQSVLRDEKSMLVEWTKICFASWFCLAILGGVNYRNVPVLSRLDNVPAEYKVKSRSTPTLERATFNWLAWKFDTLGKAVMENGSQGTSLSKEITTLVTLQDRLSYAIMNCKMEDAECLRKYLTGEKDPSTVTAEEAKKDSSGSLLGALTGGATDMFAHYASMVVEFFNKMTNPAYWLFPILIWILDIVRAFINFFVLLSFGIIAAVSLFFIKVLCVFMVIPSYRGRVIGMFKETLSAAMYGFAMNLILWISLVITKGLNEASANIIINRLTSPTSALSFAGEMGVLMMSNFLTSLLSWQCKS